MNVDGASSIDGSGTSSIGVIIRDDLGGIVAALCKVLPVHYPAELTGFFALEHRVLLAQDLNISNVIFESDAASVISSVNQACSGGAMGAPGAFHCVCKISLLILLFPSCEKDLQHSCS